MNTAERMTERARRQAVLSTLLFATGQTATARDLRDTVENVHGITATVDRIRSDLAWLQDIGMVRLAGDAATITEEGREVVTGRRDLPGVH